MTPQPAGDAGRLDWRTVGNAAGVAVAVTLPPTVAVRLLRGDTGDGEESPLWVVAVLALFAGFVIAGHVAGRRQPDAPLLHAAAAGSTAFAVLAAIAVVRRLLAGDGISAPLVITLGLLLQITVSLAVLGAYLGLRRRARRSPRAGP